MIKKAIIVILLLSCMMTSSYAQQKNVEVSYVGNAGFLINIGDKKILIDAIFKGFEGAYFLPQEIQDKLTSAEAPFDNVDLVLLTHAHGDHINPDMVLQHMKHNPKAIFASTKQTVDALNTMDTLNNFQERRIAFNPTKEKSDSKVINDISIETFYLPHGPDSRIVNIGFLISVDGTTIFQTGDVDFDQFTFEEFRALQLPEKKIDLAFIQHFYLTGDSLSTKFVKEAVAGNYIIPIHYHFTTPAFDSTIVRQNYPDAIIFEKELESWKMPDRNDEAPTSTAYYFNQSPPGDSAVIFAPGIISTDTTIEHGYPCFSPDGNEVYWQSNLRHKDKETDVSLNRMRCIDGKWTKTEPSPYGGMPSFSTDGNKLFFIHSSEEEEKELYFIEKKGENWSDKKSLNIIARYPELKYIYGPSITNNGTLYFFGHTEELETRNNFGIYRTEFIDGAYAKPELLPQSINTAGGVLNWTPFIAPDESYLLFSSNRLNNQQDIFISFRQSDRTWTEAYNLGKTINLGRGERFPAVSPDGKYLFFTRWISSNNEDIMWVSAKIIDDIKKEVYNK